MNEVKEIKCDDGEGGGCGVVDHALFDGYSFGGRTMEGVMFKAFYRDGELVAAPVDGWNSAYLCKLNQEYWSKQANAFVRMLDLASCPKCKGELVMPDFVEEYK